MELSASISFIDLPGSAESATRRLAVLVESTTACIWTCQMLGGGYKGFTVMDTNFQRFLMRRREWAPGSAFVHIEFRPPRSFDCASRCESP